jgi:hypothetical protein
VKGPAVTGMIYSMEQLHAHDFIVGIITFKQEIVAGTGAMIRKKYNSRRYGKEVAERFLQHKDGSSKIPTGLTVSPVYKL